MHEAVDHGLDMAIVNYSKIYPLYKIPEAEVDLARKLIYYDQSSGDPLQVYMEHFAGTKGKQETTTAACRHALGRGQAEVGDHQRRKVGRRRRQQEVAGRNSGTGAGQLFTARPDQQHPARRHADGRRPVRCTQDAIAFGTRLGRSDEGRRGLSRTEDGKELRVRRREPSCWPR